MPESYIDGVIDLIGVILLILTGGGVLPGSGALTYLALQITHCELRRGARELA